MKSSESSETALLKIENNSDPSNSEGRGPANEQKVLTKSAIEPTTVIRSDISQSDQNTPGKKLADEKRKSKFRNSNFKASLDRLVESMAEYTNQSSAQTLSKFPRASTSDNLDYEKVQLLAVSSDEKDGNNAGKKGILQDKAVPLELPKTAPFKDNGLISSLLRVNNNRRNRVQERYNESLITAVFESKPLDEITKLLDKGASIDAQCRDTGASALHVAALTGNNDVLRLLISRGADLKARDRAGKLPIHVAAWEGAASTMQFLSTFDLATLDASVKPCKDFVISSPDSWNHKHDQINKLWQTMETITEGSTPLHVACRRTKESCVKVLIDAAVDTLKEDAKGLYPVDVIGMDAGGEEATSDGSLVGIAKLLIDLQKKTPSVTARTASQPKGWLRLKRLFSVEEHDVRPVTALHTAVNDNNLNLITILMDEGADALVWNEDGETPLHLAVKKKFINALCLMLRHGDNLERGAVNAADNKGRTLLHLAVAEEWTDGISILLENDANITKTNERRETVLHLAASSNNLKILNELLTVPTVETIINAVDVDCYAPIHKAVENGNLKSVEALVNSKAKADVLLPDGRTLLHIMAENNAEKLLLYLMNATQLIRLIENKTAFKDGGMTALHIAASLGHLDLVNSLLNLGSDIRATTDDNVGSTPLHLAAKNDEANVIDALLTYCKARCNPDILQIKDSHGWCPLHIAAGHGYEECVELLLRAGADIGLTVQDEQGTNFTGLDIIMTCVHKPVDFLIKILDSYIIVDSKVPVTNPQCALEVYFDFLLPSCSDEKQLVVLEAVLNNGSETLEEAFFLHPIVQTFIHLKSKNMIFFFALFFDLFFFLALYLSIIAYHGPFTLQQPVYRYILIGLLSINIIFETINMARLQRYYLKDPETWIKWFVYTNILVIVIHPTELVLRYNMAVSILSSWTELLLIIAKYPAWGIYVLMFATVAGTILKVLAVFSLLLVGFAFTFRALFQEKGPFNSVWGSMVKVIIMVYELDYRGTMEETKDEGPFFADVARLFYLLFVLMVSVSLVNLMLGLAVSDIADLKRKGGAKRLAKQVAFLGGLENLLYSWPLNAIPFILRYRKVPRCLVVKTGSRLGKTADSPIPPKLKEAIVEKARSVQQSRKDGSLRSTSVNGDSEVALREETSSISIRKSLSTSRNKIHFV